MPGWVKQKLESRLPGEISINLSYADDTTVMAESKEELKSLLMKLKDENEKVALKLNVQKRSWLLVPSLHGKQMGKQWKQWQTFWGSKITLDGAFIYEIKRCLLLERNVMTNLDSILKSRNITLPTKVHLVSSVQSLSRVQLFSDHSTPGLPVHHQFPEFTQTHVHWSSDAIQPPRPLSSPSPPTFILSQHQGLFKWVSSSHQVAKVLEF